MDKEQARKEFVEALHAVQAAADTALAKAKAHIGDQDADGDVDLTDVRLKASAAVGGVSKREAIFLAVGLAAGFVLAKVIPWALRLVS